MKLEKNSREKLRITIPTAEEWERDAFALIVFVVLFAMTMLMAVHKGSGSHLGPIGDWIGGLLNPIVAVMALLGLSHSVKLQRQMLADAQRDFSTQLKVQQRQAIRETFFDLLGLRAEAVSGVTWQSAMERLTGRQAIKGIVTAIRVQGEARPKTSPVVSASSLASWGVPQETPSEILPYLGVFATAYANDLQALQRLLPIDMYGEDNPLLGLESELGHVFRATYQILKFIHAADLEDREKFDLVNYLRAQMSESEFALYALSACTSIGRKSRAVAIAFDLFENRLRTIGWVAPIGSLFDPKHFQNSQFASELEYVPIAKPRRVLRASDAALKT